MSLQSWKEEFYLIEADKVPKSKALAHSLKKWLGLTEKNLKKHHLTKHGSRIIDERNCIDFIIASSTCALCYHWFTERIEDVPRCKKCPLTKANKGMPCDDETGNCSPYHYGIYNEDLKPMIALLRKAIRQQNLQ